MLPMSAVQVTAKPVTAVAPSLTATVRGLGAVTVQLVATPVSSTVWLLTLSPVKVTPVLLLLPIGWLLVPSTVTVYPSVSGLSPDVLVVTRRLPLGGGGPGGMSDEAPSGPGAARPDAAGRGGRAPA